MDKEFSCISKRLANYLKKHGAIFIRCDSDKGNTVYIFQHDDALDTCLDCWEVMQKRSMF